MINQTPIAVYIHFPYCKSRCPYCDFFRSILPKTFEEKEIIERYRQDIKYFADLMGDRLVKSIFFGGGTPSLLSPNGVQMILDELSRNFCIKKDAEISLEANPNTFAIFENIADRVKAHNWVGECHELDLLIPSPLVSTQFEHIHTSV